MALSSRVEDDIRVEADGQDGRASSSSNVTDPRRSINLELPVAFSEQEFDGAEILLVEMQVLVEPMASELPITAAPGARVSTGRLTSTGRVANPVL